jgi:hypothetical protein
VVRRRAPDAAFVVALVGSLIFLVVQAGHLWFFGDDWDFLTQRGVLGKHALSVWTPHNEHWSTLPILLYRGLFSVFGIRHYLPYASSVIVAHGLVVLLMWSLLKRAGIRPWIAASFGVVLAVMGGGSENTLWDFQVGFVGSVMFGLLALRLMPAEGGWSRRDGWALLALVASLMCSGQGLTMLTVITAYALLARGIRTAGVLAGVGLLTYLLWYAAAGHAGMPGQLDSPLLVPDYLWNGLGHVWESMTGITGLGLTVVAAALASLLRPGRSQVHGALCVAGLAGAVCMFALAALTRAHLGLDGAQNGRYMYIAAVLTTPLLAVATQALLGSEPHTGPLMKAVSLGLLTLIVLQSAHAVIGWRKWRVGLLEGAPQRIVAAAAVATSGETLLRQLPSPQYDPNLSAAAVAAMGREGALPRLGPNLTGLIEARSRLEVVVTPGTLSLPPAARVVGVGTELGDGELATGCRKGHSAQGNGYLDVRVGRGGVRLVLRTSGSQVVTQLVDGTLQSSPEQWATTPGASYAVGSTAAGTVLRVTFPQPVDFSVCPS